jgi:hypothetical protein
MFTRATDSEGAGELERFETPVLGCNGPALVHRFVSSNGTRIKGRQYLPHIEFYREVMSHADSQAGT